MHERYGYDERCPEGFRLLIQLVDAETVNDAIVVDMYGADATRKAKYVHGTMQPVRPRADWKQWTYHEQGFRVYVPLKKKGA